MGKRKLDGIIMKNINFRKNPIDHYNSIYINLSGGTDSALLFFLIAKHIYDNNLSTKITTATCIEPQPYYVKNDWNVKKIIPIVQNMFPTVKISKPLIKQLEGYTRIKTQEDRYPKVRKMKEWTKENFAKGDYDLSISALSSFPPYEELVKNKELMESTKHIGPENRTFTDTRNEDIIIYHNGVDAWSPFINFTKKDIARLYEYHDLMENLFPYTASCNNSAENTNNFTTPCLKCFWCLEKHWAFGLYDYPKRLLS